MLFATTLRVACRPSARVALGRASPIGRQFAVTPPPDSDSERVAMPAGASPQLMLAVHGPHVAGVVKEISSAVASNGASIAASKKVVLGSTFSMLVEVGVLVSDRHVHPHLDRANRRRQRQDSAARRLRATVATARPRARRPRRLVRA